MAAVISRGLRNEEGQGLVEYALIILLVAVVLVGALTSFGVALSGLYQQAVSALG
jgi:pilus assembly protein Flp/PilA